MRLFLHCVRVWLQVFRATSLKVFLALSLSFTSAFSFLYSFYSLFSRITNTLVSRRQGSRIETRRSSPHRKTGCVHPPRCLRITLRFRNSRRPVVFCVKHVRKEGNLDYSIETSSLVIEPLTPERQFFMIVTESFPRV